MISLLQTILVGAVIGWLASIIGKTNNQMGCLWNIIVGIAGGALGQWLASRLFDEVVFDEFSLKGFFISLGGAVLLVLLLRGIGILRKDRK